MGFDFERDRPTAGKSPDARVLAGSQDIRRRRLHEGLRLMRVEPDAVTVRALIDLNPVPFAGDQIVAALGALHVVRLAFALGGGPHDRRVLLPQQLGIATREVLVLVLARTIVRHGAGGGAGGGRICSVSPPGLATGTRPGGDDDSPE